MDLRSPQSRPLQEQVRNHAPPLAQGYCLEFVSSAGDVVRQPREGCWRLAPFEPPHGVPEGCMRVLYTSREGALLPPVDPANPMPTVTVCFGLRPEETPPVPAATPRAASGPPPPTPLPADLHPAAESEESMEREIFSQHIERNEYHNFKLRAETQTVECMYGIIQRMMAERHALLQSTLAAPRQFTRQCTQLVESMGEAMRSFHTVIGMQSMALQSVQNQMELALVPPAPPPPPDYVGLGKTLLAIIRDLGMKAMDARAERRSLPANKGLGPQEPAADLDPKASEPNGPPHPASSQETAAPSTPERSEGTANAEAAESLRRVLTRMGGMGEVDIARAFAGPEQFANFLTDMRKEMEAGRAEAASRSTPARCLAKSAPGAVTTAAVSSSKTAQPPGGTRQTALVQALSPVPSGTSQTSLGRTGPMFPRL